MPKPTVSVVLPVRVDHAWQLAMTRCAIDTLRCTTDRPFELVVVEHRSHEFRDCCDLHINPVRPVSPNHDTNLGLEAANGEFVVYTQNDIFVRPGWLDALLACFDQPQCGLATLMSSDLRHTPLGTFMGQPVIMEGIYGPFMMMRRGDKFNADLFPTQFGDTDLIMRKYQQGLRMYRNCAVVIHHLNKQTLDTPENARDFEEAKVRFQSLYVRSPYLWAARVLHEGLIL